jgi:uncharacterized protein
MENNKVYYNVHTHVFDRKCIPTQILGKKWGWLLEKLIAAKSDKAILLFLQFLSFFFRNSGILERAKMLFRAFSLGDQWPVIKELIREYKEINQNVKFRFVLLCQDMDCNGVPKPLKDLRAQADEIYKLKQMYRNSEISEVMIPFIGVHPDNHPDALSLLAFVKDFIENKKFCGIKIYPAAGHYPNHPKLKFLWDYCEKNEIPVMTHSSCGPIYYRGSDIQSRLGVNPPYAYLKKDNEIQANFTSTSTFKTVLNDYPDLKICFAHCGGNILKTDSPIEKIQHQWMMDILSLSSTYKNVYFDIAFINHSEEALIKLQNIIQTRFPDAAKKVLFGTDFYVNKHKCSEADAVKNSSSVFKMSEIARQNPMEYLKLGPYIMAQHTKNP